MRYFSTHAGRGVLGVGLAALLLAWPPACSWVVAVYLLFWAADQLRISFREIEHAEGFCAAVWASRPAGLLRRRLLGGRPPATS